MSPQSHSYGTGSRPERAPSSLPMILLALFFLTPILFIFYFQSEESPSAPAEEPDHLAQLFEENPSAPQRCTDACGLGLELSVLSEAQQRYWSLPTGVFVESVDPDGDAYTAGLREGDILVSINDEPTPDLETARQLLSSPTGDTLRLTYYREQTTTTVTISLTH